MLINTFIDILLVLVIVLLAFRMNQMRSQIDGYELQIAKIKDDIVDSSRDIYNKVLDRDKEIMDVIEDQRISLNKAIDGSRDFDNNTYDELRLYISRLEERLNDLEKIADFLPNASGEYKKTLYENSAKVIQLEYRTASLEDHTERLEIDTNAAIDAAKSMTEIGKKVSDLEKIVQEMI